MIFNFFNGFFYHNIYIYSIKTLTSSVEKKGFKSFENLLDVPLIFILI